jgi:hypothetical protein
MMIVSSDNPWYFCRKDLSKRYLDDGCSMRLEMEGTVYRERYHEAAAVSSYFSEP